MTDILSMTAQQVEQLPEAEAQQVLEAWVKAKRPELPRALSQSGSRAHAKLAKKALYRLQSSGVAVEPASPEAAPSLEAGPARNEFRGVLSMQLGTGERAFFFAHPVRGGGLEIFQGLVHDEFGIAQIGSERANRNAYRRRMQELEGDPSESAMIVPFERIQLELGRAMTLNERTKTPYGEEIEQALHRLGIRPQDPDFPIPAPEPVDADTREDGAALHVLPEVTQWMPSERDLVVLTQRLDALSALPLGEAQRAQRGEALAKELSAEVFTPAVRQLYARRLWYSAEVMEALGRADDAAKARAEARRLFHEPSPSRFAEQLFVKVLATMPKAQRAGALPALPPLPRLSAPR